MTYFSAASDLQSSAQLRVEEAADLIARVCEHYNEHGDAAFDGQSGTIVTDYGRASLSVAGDDVSIEVRAGDDVGLSYMKIGMAEHLAELSARPIPPYAWAGDGTDRKLPFFGTMTVVGSEAVTPHLRRVRLTGDSVARFAHGGYHIRLVIPPAGRDPVWPTAAENGTIAWPQGEDAVTARVYTIRRIDVAAKLIDIDIVIHPGEETPGSNFALAARPGDRVGLMGPGGGGMPAARSLFLFGDETALPAIARILEDLPPGAKADALIEVADETDRIEIRSAATTTVRYLVREGAPAGTTGALASEACRLTLGDVGEDGFVWAGCELSDFKAIRRHVRSELKLPKDRHLVVAYWRRGVAG